MKCRLQSIYQFISTEILKGTVADNCNHNNYCYYQVKINCFNYYKQTINNFNKNINLTEIKKFKNVQRNSFTFWPFKQLIFCMNCHHITATEGKKN